MSVSQFAELIGIDPKSFVGVEVDRRNSTVTVFTEGDGYAVPPSTSWIIAEAKQMQTSGTFPQLTQGKGGKKGGGKSGGKRGC